MDILPKRLTVLAVGALTLALVALTGIGNFYQGSHPQRALAFNPFDVDARATLIEQSVLAEAPTASPDLATVAQQAIRFAPIDARSYSLLAEVQQQLGNDRLAESLFGTALTLSKTEGLALQRTLQSALTNRDFAGALDKLDILFRRYPAAFSAFAPAIPPLLSDQDGYQLALAVLRNDPPWRGRFLSFLDRDPASIDLAYRLQLALNGSGNANRPGEVGGTLNALIRNRDFGRAFRLFLLTQSEEDRQHGGYIFNAAFDLEPSGRPFDWTIHNSPGVNMFRETREQSGAPESSLLVQFLGKPVKRIGIGQYIYLPPGEYRLRADIDAANLRAPKGLYFSLACIDPRDGLARLDVPEGSYRARTLEADFDLPDSSCKMLRLDMQTDLIAESFRYAYTGSLSIQGITIDKRTS